MRAFRLGASPVETKPLTADEFTQLRDASWRVNASLWRDKLRDDAPRMRVFEEVGRAVLALKAAGEPLRLIVDVGAGDGALLMRLAAAGIDAELVGIDKCPVFATAGSAGGRVRHMQADMEKRQAPLLTNADIVLSTFALIEMPHLDMALLSIRAMMRVGGTAMISILDEQVEYERYHMKEQSALRGAMLKVDDELAIQSLFSVRNTLSTAPYFRILRSRNEYMARMVTAGLSPTSVIELTSPGGQEAPSPTSIIILARAIG